MNDKPLPADDLLHLVFGEFDDSRQATVRKNAADDAELAATVRALRAAVAAVRADCVARVSDDFNDRLLRRMPEILDRTQAEPVRPTFLTRSLTNWKWIMRYPVSRVYGCGHFRSCDRRSRPVVPHSRHSVCVCRLCPVDHRCEDGQIQNNFRHGGPTPGHL